tara:strand:- start:495 stop:992 length:498 start_codon:yes stop_codon:yes gene_type:complete
MVRKYTQKAGKKNNKNNKNKNTRKVRFNNNNNNKGNNNKRKILEKYKNTINELSDSQFLQEMVLDLIEEMLMNDIDSKEKIINKMSNKRGMDEDDPRKFNILTNTLGNLGANESKFIRELIENTLKKSNELNNVLKRMHTKLMDSVNNNKNKNKNKNSGAFRKAV